MGLNEQLYTQKGSIIINLTSSGQPDIEITFQLKTESNRQALLNLKRHENLGDNIDVIYIYSIIEETIKYPKKEGNIVYIGEAGREKLTGTRFSQHISTEKNKGGDTGTNYTLSYLYWSGKKLNLKIHLLDSKNNSKARKSIEGQLLQAHMKSYGSHPVAQGSSGESYRVSILENIEIPSVLENIVNV